MYKVHKWILPDLDLRDGVEEVEKQVDSIVQVSEPHILSYDTEDEIVFHTEVEIDVAFHCIDEAVFENYVKIYNETDGEVNDCKTEMEKITYQVMKELNLDNSVRYFMSLFDYLEEFVVSKIILKDKIFVITNKGNQVLTSFAGDLFFTDKINLGFSFKSKKEAVIYNEQIESRVEDFTYVKILKDGKVIEPKEII